MIFVAFQLLAFLGFGLSVYTLLVERKLKLSEGKYKAVCDISDRMSCSRTFSSPYGHIAGVSNAWGGIVFYFAIFFFALLKETDDIFYISVLGVLGCVYLAYVAYFKLKIFCPVCHGIYLVNVLLLILSLPGHLPLV